MWRIFKMWSGTLIPLVLLVGFFAALSDSIGGDLTWERPAAYLIGFSFHTLGMYSLARLIFTAMKQSGEAPLLLMSFEYQKILFWLTYGGLAAYSAGALYPQTFGWFGDDFIFALFVATTLSSAMVNIVLFFGWYYVRLDDSADPVPFRPLIRWLRERRENARRR